MNEMSVMEYIFNPYFLINVLWMLTTIYITRRIK